MMMSIFLGRLKVNIDKTIFSTYISNSSLRADHYSKEHHYALYYICK